MRGPVLVLGAGLVIAVVVAALVLVSGVGRRHNVTGVGPAPTPSAAGTGPTPTTPGNNASPIVSDTPAAGATPAPGAGTGATPSNFTGPECTPAAAQVSVTVDRAGPPSREVVTITGTITNHGATACSVTEDSGDLACNPTADVVDAKGRAVWYSRDPRIKAPCRQPGQVVVPPGQSINQSWRWTVGSNGAGVPSGGYTARVHWSGIDGSRLFALGSG